MAHRVDEGSSWRIQKVVGGIMRNPSSIAVMATRRALLFILTLIHTELPEKRFHVPHILAEIIERLVHSLFRHASNLTDDICVAFVIGKPPMLEFGELPDGGEGGAESRGDDVPEKRAYVSSRFSKLWE
jgi:hypothetical protein